VTKSIRYTGGPFNGYLGYLNANSKQVLGKGIMKHSDSEVVGTKRKKEQSTLHVVAGTLSRLDTEAPSTTSSSKLTAERYENTDYKILQDLVYQLSNLFIYIFSKLTLPVFLRNFHSTMLDNAGYAKHLFLIPIYTYCSCHGNVLRLIH
jgi:hypothetical protein